MSEDIKIPCAAKGCTETRIHTVRDQKFYADKGYQQPRFCRTHSAERKARHQNKEHEVQQGEREGWSRDRSVGPRFDGQEADASLLD